MSTRTEIEQAVQFELASVPAPTLTEIARAKAMRVGQRFANAIAKTATVAKEKVREVLDPPPHEVDWLCPTDLADLLVHAHEDDEYFPRREIGAVWDEVRTRGERALAVCATPMPSGKAKRPPLPSLHWPTVLRAVLGTDRRRVVSGHGHGPRAPILSLTDPESGIQMDVRDWAGMDPLDLLVADESRRERLGWGLGWEGA